MKTLRQTSEKESARSALFKLSNELDKMAIPEKKKRRNE
jgi:hypothetical protein